MSTDVRPDRDAFELIVIAAKAQIIAHLHNAPHSFKGGYIGQLALDGVMAVHRGDHQQREAAHDYEDLPKPRAS
jgi:hypothetical protein